MIKYLRYDLINLKNNFSLSLLIFGLLPIFTFIIFEAGCLIFGQGWSDMPDATRLFVASISCLGAMILAPVKLYGQITDKRAGAAFAMVPAPVGVKFASSVIMTCIVVPVILLALLFGADAIFSLIPGYGQSMIAMSGSIPFGNFSEAQVNGVDISFWTVASWVSSVLTFLLGAVCFKKNKVGKTILALILFSMVMSIIIGFFFRGFIMDIDSVQEWLERIMNTDPQRAIATIKVIAVTIQVIIITLLGGGIYYRMKTIKF